MEMQMYRVRRVTLTAPQDLSSGLTCRKLRVEDSEGQWFTIALFDFEKGEVEAVPYHATHAVQDLVVEAPPAEGAVQDLVVEAPPVEG